MYNKESSDQSILKALNEGCKDAFNLLYERHWDVVFNTVYKLSGDKDFAKDITQEVFMSIWERKEDLAILNIQAYLKVSARNQFLNRIKREKKYCSIPDLIINTEKSDHFSDHKILLDELKDAYETVISKLTSSQQVIYKMRYNESLTTKEIAKELNVSQKTIQNQLARSLLRLKKSFPFLLIFYVFL